MNSKFTKIFVCLVLVLVSACSSSARKQSLRPTGVAKLHIDHKYRWTNETAKKFLQSGTVILSHQVPARSAVAFREDLGAPEFAYKESATEGPFRPRVFAPLIGYFPPAANYVPAENESWLEIIRQSKKIVLHRGKSVVKEIQAEGEIPIDAGEYYLQHKQKEPLWYAPDEYFKKRRLAVPPAGNRLRYRRGALGRYALYPTTTFAIHCGAVWSEDVGGLKIGLGELSSIYYMLPIGAPIIVR